jgi:glycerophosphoryl diester phosphodiesterase
MKTPEQKSILDIQGHRGARGLMPENTIPAFLEAVRLGVTTVEMDIVISADGQVVVSHDPYLSHEFCLTKEGKEISEAEEKSYNLYHMNYADIKACDCGSKIHPRFPQQKKMKAYKPLLSEAIDSIEAYVKAHHLTPVRYNIETKISPDGDGVFHPAPDSVVKLLTAVVREKGIWDRTTIQSFDDRSLQVLHKGYPKISLALLVEDSVSAEEHIKHLGFTPDIYSPDYHLLNVDVIAWAHKQNMKVIPWTLNTREEMDSLIQMGVDGIITDYPNLILSEKK